MEEKDKKIEENKEMKVKEGKIENKEKDFDVNKKAIKKKEVPKEIQPKDVAIVKGVSLHISPKDSKFICKMIKKRSIDKAISMLEEVILKKRAVKMDGAEIPHRKGKGMMSGRYPFNASKAFILLLKQLGANANVNQIENPIITFAMANKATLPFKKDGKRGKRAHILIEARDKTKWGKKNK